MRRLLSCCAVCLLAPLGSATALPAQEHPSGDGLGLLDAVRMTLEHDPNIAIVDARLQSARGALEVATGKFDPVIGATLTQGETRTPLSPATSDESRTLHNTLSVSKQFRTGLSIEPQLDLLRSEDVSAGSPAADQGTIAFLIRQPLLRGRGRGVADADELVARREVVASSLDLRQTIAQRVLTVVSQYWTVAAAARNLEILRATEASSRDLMANTRKLIEADQVPSAEVVQLEANLAAQESARIGGERQLFAARQNLGREIGLNAAELGRLPLPAAPFPSVPPDEVPPPATVSTYVAQALRLRPDLRAARERQAGVEIQRTAAENALKPQLDLVLAPGYTGLVSGGSIPSFFYPLYRNIPGVSASIGFSLSLPVHNHLARGQLVEIEAAQRQSALALDLLIKGVDADVPIALDAVASTACQLEKAREAVRLFERAVINEEKKLRAGSSTLLDVITQQDRLTASRQVEVAAQLSLALSILQLRFATGTLLGEASETSSVQDVRLTTLPTVQQERSP